MSEQEPPDVEPYTFKELTAFAESGLPGDVDVQRLLQTALVLKGSVMGITKMLEDERKSAQMHVDSLAVLTKLAGGQLIVELKVLKTIRATAKFSGEYDHLRHRAVYNFNGGLVKETKTPGLIILPP